MKHMWIIPFVCLFLSLNSCKKEEEPPIITEATIVGTWKVTNINSSQCTDVDFPDFSLDVEQGECYEDQGDVLCIQATYRFTSSTFNYSYEYIENGGTPTLNVASGTYSYAGNIIELCLSDGTCRTGTASISGNRLNLRHENFTFDCQYAIEAKRQ